MHFNINKLTCILYALPNYDLNLVVILHFEKEKLSY